MAAQYCGEEGMWPHDGDGGEPVGWTGELVVGPFVLCYVDFLLKPLLLKNSLSAFAPILFNAAAFDRIKI
ncbi:hypothetical protein R6Q59_021317 [Mikania micrantha]